MPETLQSAYEKVTRQQHLRAVLKDLQAQCDTAEQQRAAAQAVLQKEQNDVDRLEGRSLAAFFYEVLGRKEEKLDRERREAYAARAKFEAADRALRALQEETEAREAELRSLGGCEQRYQKLFNQVTNALRGAGNADARELIRLEGEATRLKQQKKELQEANAMGLEVLETITQAQNQLFEAQELAWEDVFRDGTWVDREKYRHMDDAQYHLETLQLQLNRYRSELADVKVEAIIRVDVDGFTRFADCFFDDIFTNCAVVDHLDSSKIQVAEVRAKVDRVQSHLQKLLAQCDRELDRTNRSIESLVLGFDTE